MKRQEKLLQLQEEKESQATDQASYPHTEHKKVGKEVTGGQSDTLVPQPRAWFLWMVGLKGQRPVASFHA